MCKNIAIRKCLDYLSKSFLLQCCSPRSNAPVCLPSLGVCRFPWPLWPACQKRNSCTAPTHETRDAKPLRSPLPPFRSSAPHLKSQRNLLEPKFCGHRRRLPLLHRRRVVEGRHQRRHHRHALGLRRGLPRRGRREGGLHRVLLSGAAAHLLGALAAAVAPPDGESPG